MHLTGWIGLSLIGGILGACLRRSDAKRWYESLLKPRWCIPYVLFAPISIALYVFTAFAADSIDRDGREFPRTLALIFFVIQMILNWSWTPIFFVSKQLGAGIFIVLLCFINISICFLQFLNINAYASLLMIPSLIWAGFVASINIAVWRLNSPYAQPPPRRLRPRPDFNAH